MIHGMGRFRKRKISFELFLLSIGVFLVFTFSGLSAGGEENIEMLAFNISSQNIVAERSLFGWEFANPSGFKLDEGYPRPRIITPNDDGRNEEITFRYENINESSIVCWIYDIKGAVVRQLDIVESGENKFTWNGKDEDGDVVPSGIYIYQIEVEGQSINGTIVVAK